MFGRLYLQFLIFTSVGFVILLAGTPFRPALLHSASVRTDDAATVACVGVNFKLPRFYPVGYSPGSMVVDDFNGDKIPDVAVTLPGETRISVHLGDGEGGLAPGRTFLAGISPAAIAKGDFNSDGELDLMVGANGVNQASLLVGDGAGNFTYVASYPTQVKPYHIVVTDFNNDNNLDIAVTDAEFNQLSVLLGNGAGGLVQPNINAINLGGRPYTLDVADFNHDGLMDLAITLDSLRVGIFRGDGAGNFMAPTLLTISGVNFYGLKVGDFNGDGWADVAVSTFSLTVYLNNGAGGFDAPSSYTLGGAATLIKTGRLILLPTLES